MPPLSENDDIMDDPCPPSPTGTGATTYVRSIKEKLAPFFRKKCKRVRFSVIDTEVHEVPSVRQMTPEEQQQIWLNEKDFDQILKAMKYTLYLIANDTQELIKRGHKYCARGLEPIVNENEIVARVRRGKEAVMNAQEFISENENMNKKRDSGNMIAAVYGACTGSSASEAHNRALRDFEAAHQ